MTEAKQDQCTQLTRAPGMARRCKLTTSQSCQSGTAARLVPRSAADVQKCAPRWQRRSADHGINTACGRT